MTSWDPAALELISLMARSVRGPRREGLFALWLTLRVAQDLQLDPPLGERALRRRLAALESRLSSLTIPSPLRRALASALVQLQDAPPETESRPPMRSAKPSERPVTRFTPAVAELPPIIESCGALGLPSIANRPARSKRWSRAWTPVATVLPQPILSPADSPPSIACWPAASGVRI